MMAKPIGYGTILLDWCGTVPAMSLPTKESMQFVSRFRLVYKY